MALVLMLAGSIAAARVPVKRPVLKQASQSGREERQPAVI